METKFIDPKTCPHRPEQVVFYDEYMQGSFNMSWWECQGCGSNVEPTSFSIKAKDVHEDK